MGFLEKVKLGRTETAVTENFAQRIKTLAEETGMKVQSKDDNKVSALFGFGDGRSQQVHFVPAGTIGTKTVVHIYSPVANLKEHPLTSESALQLLEASSSMLVGTFVKAGNLLLVQQAMLLDELTATEMRSVVEVVTKLADDAEKRLTGQDKL